MGTSDFFAPAAQPDSIRDAGLRAYMLSIYNYMAAALLLTGTLAVFTAQSPALLNAMYMVEGDVVTGMKPLAWIIMLAPLGLAIFLGIALERMSFVAVQLSFWLYAALMGLSMSVIFLAFTGESIAQAFFITAGGFAGLSLYGYTTQKSLTAFGSFLLMGLVGIIIAGLVNLFLQSPGLQFALSVLGVLVFAGLTAFDTQRLRQQYARLAGTGEWKKKFAVMGALTLYLDFINIFLNLLNIFGERRK